MRARDQVIVPHQVGDELACRQVVEDFDLAHEMQRLPAHLVVEDQLRQAEGEHEVQHARTRH